MDSNTKNLKFTDGNTGVLEILDNKLVFTPPLYRQRYQKVKEKIEGFSHGTFTKVLDFGCSDLKFFQYLQKIPGIQEIVLLDKDETTLKSNIFRLKPMARGNNMMRTEPLVARAVCGDATVFNQVMEGTQVVTMIELIEHMYPSELPRLVDNVFRKVRPKVVVMTTPNADFNQFMVDIVPGTFRHWDHKFEWTRVEFKNWCQGVVQETQDYSVEISGCGLGPDEMYCSQMAIFLRSTTDAEESLALPLSNISFDAKGHDTDPAAKCQCVTARIIAEVSYPVNFDTPEEKDKHFTLHKFKLLISYLQSREDNKNFHLDSKGEEENIKPREEEESDDSAAEYHNPTPVQQTSFRRLHVLTEDEMQWKEASDDCHIFYVVNRRFAVFSMSSLAAWVNLDSDRRISSYLIRSTVEAKCFDCSGEGDNWKGKIRLVSGHGLHQRRRQKRRRQRQRK